MGIEFEKKKIKRKLTPGGKKYLLDVIQLKA